MWAMAAAAAASYLANEQTNKTNSTNSTRQRAFAADQATKDKDFQREMSNTAFQRQRKDLEAAGLNPLLGMGGGGASTPSGGHGSYQTPQYESSLGKAITSAIEAKQVQQQLKKSDEEIKLLEAQAQKTKVESKVISKGIPEADMKNKLYDAIRPIVDKISGGVDTAAKTYDNFKRDFVNRFHQPSIKHNYPKK